MWQPDGQVPAKPGTAGMKTITLKFSPLVADLRIRLTNAYRQITKIDNLYPSDLIFDWISVKNSVGDMFFRCSD